MAHAAESLHWYSRNGETAYEVKGANGNMRPTTLRDARKLNLVPSVTSIIRCAAAPGLERWKLDQMLHAALTLPRNDGEAEEQWIDRIWTDSRETAKKAAERGTEIHAAIQAHYQGHSYEPRFMQHVMAAHNKIELWANDRQWGSESAFADQRGYGGKVDLYSLDDGGECVVDIKTKEFDAGDDLRTWDEHAMQLSAYREGLGIPKAQCAICYVSVSKPGLAKLIEIPEDELQKGWKMFEALLAYWKAKNKYESGWMEKAA